MADMSSIERERNPEPVVRLPVAIEFLLAAAALIFVLAAILCRADGTDALNQQYWLADYSKLVLAGNLIPRWIPTGFHNLGAPSFYFYPPLAFWLAAPVRALTGIASGNGLFQVLGLLSAVGCFFTARALFLRASASPYWASIGAVLYAIGPYKVGEWYSRSSISSTVSFIFVPIFFLGFIDLSYSQTRWRGVLLLAISMAFIFLSSVPLVLVLIVCSLLAAIVYRRYITVPMVWAVSIAGLMFVALAAFQLLSILHWQDYVQLTHLENTPEYAITKLLAMQINATTYHYLSLYIVFGIVAVAAYRARMAPQGTELAERNIYRIFLAILFLMVVLEIPLISRPIWLGAPLFHLIQGAWRFYIVLVLLVSFLVACAKSRKSRRAATAIVAVWSIAAIIPLLVVLFHLHLNPHADPDTVDPPEYAPVYSLHGRYAVEAMVRRHASDSQVTLIPDASPANSVVPRRPVPNDTFDVSLSSPQYATFHRWYWPAWRIVTSDREISLRPDSIGRAVAALPAGQYQAVWQWNRSRAERAGIWVSSVAWVGVLLIAGISLIRRRVVRSS